MVVFIRLMKYGANKKLKGVKNYFSGGSCVIFTSGDIAKNEIFFKYKNLVYSRSKNPFSSNFFRFIHIRTCGTSFKTGLGIVNKFRGGESNACYNLTVVGQGESNVFYNR